MSETWTEQGGQPIPTDAKIKNRGKYGKYWDKTANVKLRRRAYGWLIIIAVVLLVVAIVDILVLGAEIDAIKLGIMGAFLVCIVIAIMMLITRTNRVAKEELKDEGGLEAAILQCPDCRNIFELQENHFHGAKKVAFTCPHCGSYGAMPDMSQRPVKKVLPEGDVREYQYTCSNCKEDIRIGIFGEEEARQSRFRACPHCGERETVSMVSRPPPLPPSDD